jgi:predicted NACHT family NTPase
MDWLLIWGVTQATGALVKPVLEDFARDVVNDSAKDYVKNCFGNIFKPLQKDAQQKALGKAIKELAQLIDDQLSDAGVPAHQTEAWASDAKEFVRSKAVQAVLRQAFESSASTVDSVLLKQGWPSRVTARLPDDFDWEIVAKTFSKRLKNLRRNDSDLRQIYEAQAIGEIAETNRQMAGIVPGFDLDAYRLAMLRQYQRLQLQSLDPDPYSYRNPQLRSVFVEQNVRECQEYAPQFLTLPKEVRRRFSEQSGGGKWNLAESEARRELVEERLRAFHSQSSRQVFEVIGDPRAERLVILGDPGSGKSSLLRYLALQWAEKLADAVLGSASVVLLIELRDYAYWPCHEAKSFLRYLHEGPTFHRINELELDRYLKSASNAVLLLDGLDEIFDEDQRKWALNDLQRFADDYRNVRIILTSRVIGYEKSQQRLTEMSFSHFMLQDLEDDQVRTFLQRWHQETFTDGRDWRRKLTQLDEAIQRTRAIRELAGNPLLLTLMAILNRQQELPRDRVRLYERSAQLLLQYWKTELLEERFPQLKQLGIGFDEKAAMLRAVAHHMQTAAASERGNIIARRDLEEILLDYLVNMMLVTNAHGVADALVEQLRGRNFILCDLGNNHYAFVHRAFLEFFCAEAFVQRFEASLDLDFLRDQVFKPHWNDESWHETLCLVAGVIGKKSPGHVAQLIEFLLEQEDPTYKFHHLFLAARCCAELRTPRLLGKAFERTRDNLEKLLRFDRGHSPLWDTEIRRKALAALVNAQLLDQPLSWLKNRANHDDYFDIRIEAGLALARGWKDDPDVLLWLKNYATRHRDSEEGSLDFSPEPLRELMRVSKDDPDTLPWLKDIAANDKNKYAREVVVREVARGWRDDPDTLPWLKNLAMKDENGSVREAVVREVARGWGDDPDTLPWLKDLTAKEGEASVRQVALQELARGWKDDPEILPLLKGRAAKGSEASVQQVALQELARGWRDDPDTLPLLKGRAANDDDWFVRLVAAQELARGWKDDPETLPLLKDIAAKVSKVSVREAVVREVARGWRDDPDTLPWLKGLAAKDDSEYVREAVVREVARGWRDDPDTLPWLKDFAVKDASPAAGDDGWGSGVRNSAIQVIVSEWPNDPSTLPLLRDRAENDPTPWLREKARQFAAEIEPRSKLSVITTSRDKNDQDTITIIEGKQ